LKLNNSKDIIKSQPFYAINAIGNFVIFDHKKRYNFTQFLNFQSIN